MANRSIGSKSAAPHEELRFDTVELRQAFGCMPSAVAAVCALDDDGHPDGMVMSTAIPVSLDPPLISVCVQNTSATWPRLRDRAWLGSSVLTVHHDVVSRALSRRAPDRFADVAWSVGHGDAVFIDDAALHVTCKLEAQIPAGDHILALLAISDVAAQPEREPLVFHRSSYRRLAS